MNWDDCFRQHGYFPTRCPEHEGHAVLPDDVTGDMHCTSGHLVLPVDLGDTRIGQALDDGHLDNRPEPEPGHDNHDWEGER